MGRGDQQVFAHSARELTASWLLFAAAFSIVVWQVASDWASQASSVLTVETATQVALWIALPPYAAITSSDETLPLWAMFAVGMLAGALWETWTPYAVITSTDITVAQSPALRRSARWETLTQVHPIGDKKLFLISQTPPVVEVDLSKVNASERELFAGEINARASAYGAILG